DHVPRSPRADRRRRAGDPRLRRPARRARPRRDAGGARAEPRPCRVAQREGRRPRLGPGASRARPLGGALDARGARAGRRGRRHGVAVGGRGRRRAGPVRGEVLLRAALREPLPRRARRRVPALRLVGFGVKPPAEGMPYDEFHRSPPQGRLAAVYSSCGIYLCPSWDEGLGMPSMEAMACGAALVTYDNGGCRDYARDGETALVARRRDVADLAAKLERVVVNEPLRGRLAAAGMRFVTTAFVWDRAVRRLEEIFGVR